MSGQASLPYQPSCEPHQHQDHDIHTPRLSAGSSGTSSSTTSGSQAPLEAPLEIQQALLPSKSTAAPPVYRHPFSPWRRRYIVVLVSVITALLSADQNLLAPNLSEAAAYFGLDDHQKDTFLGGYLMAAFFLVGAPAALLCGYFADKFNRIHMLAFIVVVGEAPCLCTYWVTQLWHFFLVRTLTGIAIGGCFPLVFSLLGDLFPVSQRAAMASVIQIAVGGGIGGGQMLAGIVGPSTNWRVPFVIAAVPTLLLTLVLLLEREPPRGGFEQALEGQLAAGAAYSESITWAKIGRLLRAPSNWIIVLQGLPGCLPWGVMQTYINDYLHQNKGFSVEVSTTILLLFGIGCGLGVLAGGAAGQALYNWRKGSMALLTGLSVLAGVGPVLFLVNANLQAMGLGVCLFMAALAGFLVSIAGPNLRAIMINVNTPETRGVALALQSVTDDLGKGLGPVIVAGFISRLGRISAFNIAVSGWVPCGLMLSSLAFTMSKDEDGMQARLAQQAARTLQGVTVLDSPHQLLQPPWQSGVLHQPPHVTVVAAADRRSNSSEPEVTSPVLQPSVSVGLLTQTFSGSESEGGRSSVCGGSESREEAAKGVSSSVSRGLGQVFGFTSGQGAPAAATKSSCFAGSKNKVAPLGESGNTEQQHLLTGTGLRSWDGEAVLRELPYSVAGDSAANRPSSSPAAVTLQAGSLFSSMHEVRSSHARPQTSLQPAAAAVPVDGAWHKTGPRHRRGGQGDSSGSCEGPAATRAHHVAGGTELSGCQAANASSSRSGLGGARSAGHPDSMD